MEEDICDITLESEALDVTLESAVCDVTLQSSVLSVDDSFSRLESQVDRFRPTCAAAVLAPCHSSTPKKPLASRLQNFRPVPMLGELAIEIDSYSY